MDHVNPEEDAATDWKTAITAVNAWRGSVLQSFSSAEQAVSETLLALSALPPRGPQIALRHLVGQRFQDLEDVLQAGGAFADEGGAAATAVAAFRSHEPLRAVFAHGVAKIALDRQGRWIVVMRVLTFRARVAERTVHVFEQNDAETQCRELHVASQRLCSALAILRKVVQPLS